MSNREHYQMLLPAIASGNCRKWNYWRIDHPGVLPNLMAVELGEVKLPYIDLSRADLSRANLCGTKLFHANLRRADFNRATLQNADLREADLSGAYLRQANLKNADLRRANLNGADLTGAHLEGADLTGASLRGTRFSDSVATEEIHWGTAVSRLEKAALRLLKSGTSGKTRSSSIAAGSPGLRKRN
jgi:uncharacterized protein YjbI with pentapeptide repeats